MKIKRLLSLCVCFSCMLCAVIFSRPSVALADEGETSGDISGDLIVNGFEKEMSPVVVSELPPDYYQGSSLLSSRTTFGYVMWSNMVGHQLQQYEARGTYEFNVPIMFRFAVEEGHTYNGQIRFPITVKLRTMNTSGDPYQMSTLNITGMTQESLYDGVSFSYYSVSTPNGGTTQPEATFWVAITFNSFQPSFTGNCYLNAMFEVRGGLRMDYTIPENNAYAPTAIFDVTCPSDYTGDLFDYPTRSVTDSTGSLITNQTEQQQQIAQQQQQQSQQQHEEMTEKVEESTNIIDKGLDRLGNTILDGIKSFFIPSNEYFTALFDDLKVWFEERMGLLSAPLVFLLDILGMFTGSVPMGEITLPAIGFGDIWISQPMTFRLSDYPVIETLQGYCHIATNIMMTLWVIELFQKKEKEVLHS